MLIFILPILKLGSFGFVFLGRRRAEYSCNSLGEKRLRWLCRCENWVCFAKNRAICRAVSTSVEGGQAGVDGWFWGFGPLRMN